MPRYSARSAPTLWQIIASQILDISSDVAMPMRQVGQIRAQIIAAFRTAQFGVRQKEFAKVGIESKTIHACTRSVDQQRARSIHYVAGRDLFRPLWKNLL
jgi:hypothetical protein